MLTTIPKPDDRLAWLGQRHPYFNASDAGCLYSTHPHRDLADVAAAKLAPKPVDNGQTAAMDRGDRLEPVLLQWWGDHHGCQVVTPDVLFVNGRLMATLDGEPVGGADVWVEAKSTSQRWDDVPAHVYWQMVAQAAASGRTEGWCVWVDSDLRFKQAEVEIRREHVADVLERVEQFMAFVDLGLTPEGVQLHHEQVARMFPAAAEGKWVTLDEAGRDAVVAWEQARLERIAAEKREDARKDEVARLLADAEGGKHNGLPLVTWRQNKPSQRFATRQHADREPACHEAYSFEAAGARVMRATKELRTFGAMP